MSPHCRFRRGGRFVGSRSSCSILHGPFPSFNPSPSTPYTPVLAQGSVTPLDPLHGHGAGSLRAGCSERSPGVEFCASMPFSPSQFRIPIIHVPSCHTYSSRASLLVSCNLPPAEVVVTWLQGVAREVPLLCSVWVQAERSALRLRACASTSINVRVRKK